jgi:photosystem II stability/assembly factor-like uncharacterized protein
MGQQGIERLAEALHFRLIGPHRGGRVVAVAGHPIDPMTFYFGACAGGVWKTTDGGVTWENISDGYFARAAVGAIAVSEADPNVIYVGTGEACIRGNVSHGDGVYRSTDGGRTWTNVGLRDTRHIARVRVHPRDPDLVYVAALGHAHGPNQERGVFRSRDGGKTWEKVLYRDEQTGAIDLVLDPGNPRILYAALWQAVRRPWELVSGGPGSGLFRSVDGGDTWQELSRRPELPQGVLGRIGLATTAAKPGRVWAIVEAEDGALFRSDDYGDTWQRVSDKGDLRWRAWYFHHLCADPQDADTLWVLNLKLWKSIDGGQTFTEVPTPHGDHHDHWIDPTDPRRMINGNDGGACVSFDGGRTWSTQFNQPTAQMYHVTVDTRFPYRVYGSQQDNTAICLPSVSVNGAITPAEWYEPGGGESGYIAVKPDDPDIVIGGAIGSGEGNGRLIRYNHRTGEQRNITIWPEELGMAEGARDLKYRFQWTFPIEFSPHDPHTLYVTSNVVHRSRDLGRSWEVISPDLTRNDPDKLQPSGGPITKDNTGAEVYCTIFAFRESPHQPGVFWAGSDDGLVHVSRDGGQTWHDVTPPDLPEWATVSILEPSPHHPATCYLAAHNYRLDDFRPYLFKTTDFGQTWTRITQGIPDDDFTRVLRADPVRPGLLYAGTETSLYVSFDDGGSWQRLQSTLPVCPIYDLVVKDSDLVVATHGRSFWILDDLTPLRQFDPAQLDQPAYLYQPRPTVRVKVYRGFGSSVAGAVNYRWAGPIVYAAWVEELPTAVKEERLLDAGKNPPDGVIVTYFLRERPSGEVRLSFLDLAGNELRSFSSEKPADPLPGLPKEKKPKEEPRLAKEPGMHRFIWDLRVAGARRVAGDKSYEEYLAGPRVPPGTYQVRLTVDGQSWTQSFEVLKDPRIEASEADLHEQFDLLIRIRDKVSEAHDAINQIRNTRQQLGEWRLRIEAQEGRAELIESMSALEKTLTSIEDELIQPKMDDPRQFPWKLTARLAALTSFVESADDHPTAGEREVYSTLASAIDAQLARLRQVLETDLAELNRRLAAAGVPAIVPRTSLVPA